METYYKAVRPDGTSFYDHATKWSAGKITRHPQAGTGDASEYLSVSTSPTDCTGFEWPCRLLTVRPVRGHAVFTPDAGGLPNKRASDAWMVTGELPAHEAFGPQGVHVVALIESARNLTADQASSLRTARDAAGYVARSAAWDAARDAAGYAAGYAAWDAAQYAAGYVAWDAAWDAAGHVARALIVRDLITTEQYDTLTLPWRKVVGRIHPDDPEV